MILPSTPNIVLKIIINIFGIIEHIRYLISSHWVETTVTQKISQVHQLELDIKVDTSSVVKTLTIFASLSDSLPRFSRKEGVGVVLWILMFICSEYSILHLNQPFIITKNCQKQQNILKYHKHKLPMKASVFISLFLLPNSVCFLRKPIWAYYQRKYCILVYATFY